MENSRGRSVAEVSEGLVRCAGDGGDGEKQMRSQLSQKIGFTNGLYVERTRGFGLSIQENGGTIY